ncbi:NAD-dependent deacetylase [Campylobacter coli]|uniref:SIR2 family NAD-dependent protein deacylase n=1 Tax=Campylobacter coli TaxID=195 RepID=UPI0002581DD0|nr:Sir2 family NAD-dependent protein deacetylase [Campylobacter coli]EAH5523698.1 NAD-dependent deacetylase [Campylobacter coli]EAI5963310.1 NAD-dependent deacetylase [Campylobacter coli]EAI9339463.1 NAD-dependent deacetylase [Campylobacter coli]EAI9451402.1 NAD-dependent deacetylase [Campylobacter coli]EAI9614646.1 NAD-dependent deacetylase [Campylobacter coli]
MQIKTHIKEALDKAEVIIITAGAGMGVDSGLPDFRGKDGFWRAYPYLQKLGIDFERMANPTNFYANPQLAWAFYGHRFKLYKDTKPHKGYEILLKLAKSKQDYYVVTTNVDGHFKKAGFDESKIYEFHGSINYLQCFNYACGDLIWQMQEELPIDMEEFKALSLPKCPRCQGLARPNILMFNDGTFNDSRYFLQKQSYKNWLKPLEDKNILIIELGAGKAIPSMRMFGEDFCKKSKTRTLLRINPNECDFPKFFRNGIGLKMKALEALEMIDSLI